MRLLVCVLVCALALSGCGGGSSSSAAVAPVATPPPTGGGNDQGGGTDDGGTDDGGGGVDADPDPEPDSGSDPDPGADPDPDFGLTTRESRGASAFPTTTGAATAVALDDAFPNLAFSVPVFAAAVPGTDRVAVMEQGGRVRTTPNDPASTATSLMLDLSAVVIFAGEQGLLGLAFHPDFTSNGFLYVHYIAPSPRRTVISRFSVDLGTLVADPASEQVVLEVEQPFSNHNGGMLAFGPDGFLYIALGDGGSGGDPLDSGQDTSTLLGSLLRIDVDSASPYAVPADNPLVGTAGARPEIWAWGLRNPFRFSFDRQLGTLWLGDVGQGAREEVDIITRGGNYGWRVKEGNLDFGSSSNVLPGVPFTDPVHDYGRDLGRSIIGGYVYRGSALPDLFGNYIFGDFGSGQIWALDQAGDGSVTTTEIATLGSLTSFGEDPDGELLAMSGSGNLRRLAASSGGGSAALPQRLSDTGAFSDVANLVPAPGYVPYGVNAAFWSDGAAKQRWLGIPDGTSITFAADGAWVFPLGTVVVKQFDLDTTTGPQRLETRFLVRSEEGWSGYSYRWDPDGNDASLLPGADQQAVTVSTDSGPLSFDYQYPSRTDCLGCHTEAAGRILGVRTVQLNGDFAYPAALDNQLRSLDHIGLFDVAVGDPAQYGALVDPLDAGADLEARARAYLATNCAQCHQPGGPAPVGMDLRVGTALADTGLVDVPPTSGDLGLTDARLVAPGAPQRSVLLERMRRLDSNRMPPLGSVRVDTDGVALIEAWINAL